MTCTFSYNINVLLHTESNQKRFDIRQRQKFDGSKSEV